MFGSTGIRGTSFLVCLHLPSCIRQYSLGAISKLASYLQAKVVQLAPLLGNDARESPARPAQRGFTIHGRTQRMARCIEGMGNQPKGVSDSVRSIRSI